MGCRRTLCNLIDAFTFGNDLNGSVHESLPFRLDSQRQQFRHQRMMFDRNASFKATVNSSRKKLHHANHLPGAPVSFVGPTKFSSDATYYQVPATGISLMTAGIFL